MHKKIAHPQLFKPACLLLSRGNTILGFNAIYVRSPMGQNYKIVDFIQNRYSDGNNIPHGDWPYLQTCFRPHADLSAQTSFSPKNQCNTYLHFFKILFSFNIINIFFSVSASTCLVWHLGCQRMYTSQHRLTTWPICKPTTQRNMKGSSLKTNKKLLFGDFENRCLVVNGMQQCSKVFQYVAECVFYQTCKFHVVICIISRVMAI